MFSKRWLKLLMILVLFAMVFSALPAVAQEPVDEPVEEPVDEPVNEPVDELIDEQVDEPVDEPVDGIEEPVEEPIELEEVESEEVVPEVESSEIGTSGSAQSGAWSATIYISNPNDAASTGSITFYATDGSTAATYDFTSIAATGIPAHGSAAIDVGTVGITDASWQGAAVVASSPQVAVQVGLQVDSSTDRMVYSGFSQGAQKVSSPAIICNTYDQDSDLVVMNTSSAEATVNVAYLASGTYTPASATSGPYTIPANSSRYLDVCTEIGATGDWLGSATVTGTSANDALVAVVFQPYVVAPKAVAYEALSGSGSSTVVFPTAQQKIYSAQFTSFYAIQNVGAVDTTATLTVYNLDGTSAGTVSQLLAPGAKVSWQPQDAGAPSSSFLGSAVATASGGGELAAITNIGTLPISGCPTGAGQTAAFLNPSSTDGAATLAIPWVEYKAAPDWRSFIAVQNTGASASGTVTVNYYGPDGISVGSADLGTIGAGAKANSNASSAFSTTDFSGSVEIVSTVATDVLVGLTTNQQADSCHAASTLAIPVQ